MVVTQRSRPGEWRDQNPAYGRTATAPCIRPGFLSYTLDPFTMRYLVTGGAGFIGSHLVDELLRRGERVRVVDSFITGHRRNLHGLDDAEVIAGDLADPDVARRACDGIDYVLHHAAIPSVPRSVADPQTSHRANVDATVNLLVAARDSGVRRVVYAGSSSAYGNSPSLPKHEDMASAPLSPYALQKLVGEEYCKLFTLLYGLETVTTRFFNVFGPRQDPSSPYSGVVALFITKLLSGEQATIFGDGENSRDFTYVANVVDGVLRAATATGVAGEVVNVATGGRVTLNELFATLRRLIGATGDAAYGPPRAGDVAHSQADISRARTLLGYQPHVSLEEGLRRTVEWYRAQAATIAAPAS